MLILFLLSILISILGIYLNLCFLRVTYLSTVYSKSLLSNIRFLSSSHLFLAIVNVICTIILLGEESNRFKKSEEFLTTMLCISKAIPSLTIPWITVERAIYQKNASLLDSCSFRHFSFIRLFQLFSSISISIFCKIFYEDHVNEKNEFWNISIPLNETLFIEKSIIKNYYFEICYFGLIIISCLVMITVYKSAKNILHRSKLLSGMQKDQKALKSTLSFSINSYFPLLLLSITDNALNIILKISVIWIFSIDVWFIVLRTFLPIFFPLSLIIFNKDLRIDFISNIILCRKANLIHRESRVTFIAARESQDSIIANLKIIGILSDVDSLPERFKGTSMENKGNCISVDRPPFSGIGNSSISMGKNNSTLFLHKTKNMNSISFTIQH